MAFKERYRLLADKVNLKIWGWPLLFFSLIIWAWELLIFFVIGEKGLAPGSLKEAVFVQVLGIGFVCFFWILSYRYRRITGSPVRKRTKVFLITFTVLFVLGLIAVVVNQFVNHLS
jgi:hypothetical protein